MPGMQGGPLMHVIAAKAVAFREALTPDWRAYQRQIVANAKALADALLGARLPAGDGRHRHPPAADGPHGRRSVTGKDAQEALDRAWITVNKNTIPFETRSPMVTSGIRIGTPAVTTRGMKEPEMDAIAELHRPRAPGAGRPARREAVGAGGGGGARPGRFPLYPERLA